MSTQNKMNPCTQAAADYIDIFDLLQGKTSFQNIPVEEEQQNMEEGAAMFLAPLQQQEMPQDPVHETGYDPMLARAEASLQQEQSQDVESHGVVGQTFSQQQYDLHYNQYCQNAMYRYEQLRAQLAQQPEPRTSQEGHKCESCGKVYKVKRSFEKHVCSEQALASGHPFSCETCGKTFAKPESLKGHERTHQPRQTALCEFCPKEFSSKGNLTKHVKQIHFRDQNPQYKCDYCGHTSNQKGNVKTHCEMKHRGMAIDIITILPGQQWQESQV